MQTNFYLEGIRPTYFGLLIVGLRKLVGYTFPKARV